jgi:hypothetical protein
METRQALESAMREAMRSRNETALRTLRMVISSIKFTEIEKGKPVDEAGVQAVLQKEIKSRRESIQDAEKAGRADLIQAAKDEIGLLEGYLPKQLEESELLDLVKAAAVEAGAVGPADMGKVMKTVMPKVQGRAPGDVVSAAVKKVLSG